MLEQDWFSPGLRGDEAGGVVVAVFSNLSSARVRTFIHLKLVAAIHLEMIWNTVIEYTKVMTNGRNEWVDQTIKETAHLTHVKGDDTDLYSVSIVHSYHPLTLVVVEGIKSSGVSVHMPSATVVCRSIAVVPGQQLWVNYQIAKCPAYMHCSFLISPAES